MQDVVTISENEKHTELDTGSPHYVAFMDKIPNEEFVSVARKIRQNPPFTEDGINVNFAQVINGHIVFLLSRLFSLYFQYATMFLKNNEI